MIGVHVTLGLAGLFSPLAGEHVKRDISDVKTDSLSVGEERFVGRSIKLVILLNPTFLKIPFPVLYMSANTAINTFQFQTYGGYSTQ